jgi:flagellar protein FliS
MTRLAHDAYLESRILSAAPLELVRILYREAGESVEHARAHLAAGDIAARSAAITRTMEILIELSASLDHQRGGELAARLEALYDYMRRRLLDANFEQRDQPLEEVRKLLRTLSEAWDSIAPEAAPRAPAGTWAVTRAEPEYAAHGWDIRG